MTAIEPIPLREVGRAAVRAKLAELAYEMFLRDGYDAVTINDLAAAAGVSRSTVLRLFDTKEDVALSTMDARGILVAKALQARPSAEDDWTALRRALDVAVESYDQDPGRALALTRLIRDVRALRAH